MQNDVKTPFVIKKLVQKREFSDIIPVECGREACKPQQAWGPVAKNWFVLHFVISGKGSFRTERGEYSISDGDIFIIKPGEITYYEADNEAPWEYVWISFYSSFPLPRTLCENDRLHAPYLKECFEAAISRPDSLENKRGYEELLLSKIWEIMSLVKLNEAQAPSQGSYIKKALSIIEYEYQTGITATDIADRLHLNRSYFTKMFTEAMKISPGKYLYTHRMNRAAQFLRSRKYSVTVVASSVGFSDVFAFSRAFKSHFGISPGKYVKNEAQQ